MQAYISTAVPAQVGVRDRLGPLIACAPARRRVIFAPPTRRLTAATAGVAQSAEHLFCKQVVRGSSPLASSLPKFLERSKNLEGCPSGQREQTVNLPAMPSMVRIHHPPRAVWGPGYQTTNLRWTSPAEGRRSYQPNQLTKGNMLAGVAQLVERQPSKLNVAGSNPVSRSSVPPT